IGSESSAGNREHIIRNMIVKASNLYKDGLIEQSCDQLHYICAEIVGDPRPPDFIGGDPDILVEFRQRVLILIEALSSLLYESKS
nr:hypothetical protein [Nitrososphaeria archaeon]NIQ32305.1 hypothetical protein [Nitrososphaeria archaeon]